MQKEVDYGLALRTYMSINGLSCVGIAREIGRSPTMISYLRHKKTWHETNLDEICTALSISKEALADLYHSLPDRAK